MRDNLVCMVPVEEVELTALELVDLLEQITSAGELYRMYIGPNGQEIVIENCELHSMARIKPSGHPSIRFSNTGNEFYINKR